MGVDHLVLIRFNIGYKSEEWLKHRLEYFRSFTVPSLKAQTEKNFKVILMVDPKTPEEVKKELGLIGYLFISPDCPVGRIFQAVISSHLSPFILDRISGDSLITTRLDSDDALAKNYIEVTKGLLNGNKENKKFVIYPRGVLWDYRNNAFYEKEEKSPPFASYMEFVKDKVNTVFCVSHGEIRGSKYPHIKYYKDLKWLQSYHGKNMLTKPDGLKKDISFDKVKSIIGDIRCPVI